MKRKIDNIRKDEKTNTNNYPHAPLTTSNHFTKTKPLYT